MLWAFFLAAIAAWILQTVLGLWQFRRFTRHVKKLRLLSRVAIGKSKGRVLAGVILLLCIDEDCRIFKGEMMEGVTIFAKFRPFEKLVGMNLLSLTEKNCRECGLNRQEIKAALSARKDYLDYQELQKERLQEAAPEAAKEPKAMLRS